MCWIPSQIWCIRAINGGISRVWSYLKLTMPVVFGIRENVWRDGTPTWKFSIWNGQFEDVFSVRGLKIVFLALFQRNPTCFPGSEWMPSNLGHGPKPDVQIPKSMAPSQKPHLFWTILPLLRGQSPICIGCHWVVVLYVFIQDTVVYYHFHKNTSAVSRYPRASPQQQAHQESQSDGTRPQETTKIWSREQGPIIPPADWFLNVEFHFVYVPCTYITFHNIHNHANRQKDRQTGRHACMHGTGRRQT